MVDNLVVKYMTGLLVSPKEVAQGSVQPTIASWKNKVWSPGLAAMTEDSSGHKAVEEGRPSISRGGAVGSTLGSCPRWRRFKSGPRNQIFFGGVEKC